MWFHNCSIHDRCPFDQDKVHVHERISANPFGLRKTLEDYSDLHTLQQ